MLKSKSGRKKGPQKSVSVDMLAIRCLHDISVRFINKENINEIYECILDAAMVITGGDKAVLRLLNPQSQRLEILAQYGFSEEFAKTFYDVEIGKILSGSALKQGKRLIISDFRKSRFLNDTPGLLQLVLAEGVQAGQATPLVSRSGRIIGILSTFHQEIYHPDEVTFYFFDLLVHQVADILERVQVEQELKHAEEDMAFIASEVVQRENLLHSVREFIIVKDIDSRILFWNGGAERGYGWTFEEVRHKKLYEVLLTKSTESYCQIQAFLYEHGYWHGDLVHQKRDGTKIIVESYWTLNYDELGRPATIIEINHDVTELRQLQRSQEIAKQRQFRSIFDSMFQLTGVLTPEGVLVDCNKTALDYMACDYEQALKRKFWEIPCWQGVAGVKEQLHESIMKAAQGVFVRFETKVKNQQGEISHMDFSLKPVFDEAGRVLFLISEGRDITTQKNYEQEMSRISLMNLVGEMAVAIGHEVRNPLTTVRGYLQHFSRKHDCAMMKEQFSVMIQELDRANNIISDFLFLAQNRSVELTKCSLNQIIESLQPLMQAATLEKGTKLQIELEPVPELLLDQKDIRQLLFNLLSNSFEAVAEGSGTVTVKTYQEEGQVILAVLDTGKGMAQSIIDKLGMPFVTTKAHGVGLGLPVCFRIAERHGAKFIVDTGEWGTAVLVKFPWEKPESRCVPC